MCLGESGSRGVWSVWRAWPAESREATARRVGAGWGAAQEGGIPSGIFSDLSHPYVKGSTPGFPHGDDGSGTPIVWSLCTFFRAVHMRVPRWGAR